MDKVVLITGSSGGLGRALAEKFLKEGWTVIATDLDELSMADLDLRQKAWVIRMDVASDASVREVFNRLSGANLKIDLIINNAGIDRYFPLSESPVENFKKVFDVNLFGAYRVNQIFLPLVKKPGGRIIHIGSESLNLTVPFMTYPITKKALENYAKALRLELGFHGIDVVVIRPGAIRTPLLEQVSKIKDLSMDWNLSAQFTKFADGAAKEIGKTITPQKAAEFIYRISVVRHPASVYKINNSLQLRIAALLPFSILEKIIRSRLKGI